MGAVSPSEEAQIPLVKSKFTVKWLSHLKRIKRKSYNCLTYVSDCHGKGDIIFLLDSSGSVGQDNFERVKSFVGDFVEPLQIHNGNYRVGLLVYSDDGETIFNLNR